MPTLVTPDRTIFRIASRSELDAWAEARLIGWQLRGNLAQLLSLNKVGNDRKASHQAGGYFVLEARRLMDVIRRDGCPDILAIIGGDAQYYIKTSRGQTWLASSRTG